MENSINILELCEQGTTRLGPGLRFTIWVQGCPFNCFNCSTPEGISLTINKLVPIGEIVDKIINNTALTGITISGGEPFLQASKLASLLSIVSEKRPELTVIIFSGFLKKQLTWPEALLLLSKVDVLIDGKYVDKLNPNYGLPGSSNQKIYFMTNRLVEYKEYLMQMERGFDIILKDRYIQTIGVPNKQIDYPQI